MPASLQRHMLSSFAIAALGVCLYFVFRTHQPDVARTILWVAIFSGLLNACRYILDNRKDLPNVGDDIKVDVDHH